MAGFYEVVLNGTVAGKDHLNTLYYRTALDPVGGLFGFGGASEVAEEVLQEIVPSYLDCHPTTYTLQSIDVYPRNGLFEALYQLPYKLDVNSSGTVVAGMQGFDGYAISVNIRFNLEPVLFGLQAFSAPKRGYISIGPINSALIQDSGELIDGVFTNPGSNLKLLAAAVSQNLESIDPPCVFFPIRVAKHFGSVSGGLLGWGYADVMSASVDRWTTFRRSRRVTG